MMMIDTVISEMMVLKEGKTMYSWLKAEMAAAEVTQQVLPESDCSCYLRYFARA